jgi:hypothetical protein
MGSTVNNAVDRTHPKDLLARLDGLKPRPATVRPHSDADQMRPNAEQNARIVDLVRLVMADLAVSQKSFAITARCTESEFSEALNLKDGRRFEAEWIWRQDDVFVRRFLDTAAAARGLTPETELAEEVRLLTALFGQLIERIVVRRIA